MTTISRCIALLLVTSLGMSQPGAVPQNPPEAPKIKTSTDLVMVPVVVHKGGVHVGDLKKEDFTLLVDEKPQAIASFEEVHTVAATRDAPRAAEEFSNVRHGQNVERLTIIAVDLVNTAPLDQLYLKQEIVKFLDGATQTSESYCLLAFTKRGIKILQGFTTDRKQIINSALKQDSQPNGREPVGSTGVAVFDQTPCAASTGNCGSHEANDQGLKELQLWQTLYKTQESLDVFRDWNARFDTLSSLQQIAQWLSGVPGRKTLVWAGSGVQLYGGVTRVAAGNGPRRDYATLNLGSVARRWTRTATHSVF
jgi:VWFA-related protein